MASPGCDVGLADMPPELLACIAEKLDRPRDLVAAQIASPLFAHVSLDRFVGCQYAGRLRALIEAGAPVGTVRVAIAHDRQALSPNLIHPAVRYSHVSVLDVLCRALFDVRIFIPFFFPLVAYFLARSFLLFTFFCFWRARARSLTERKPRRRTVALIAHPVDRAMRLRKTAYSTPSGARCNTVASTRSTT